MVKLEDVKIYKNNKNEYSLVSPKDGEVFEDIPHAEIIHWAQLYAFLSEELVESFLKSPKLVSLKKLGYFSVKKEKDGTIIVLLVNHDAEGGIHSYEDLRNFKATRWLSPS